MKSNLINNEYETYESSGILIVLITKLFKTKTPKDSRFDLHPIEVNEIKNRIIKLQEKSGETIYKFVDIDGKKHSNTFLNDIELLINQQDIHLSTSITKITITPKGYLNGTSLKLPKNLRENLSIFLD